MYPSGEPVAEPAPSGRPHHDVTSIESRNTLRSTTWFRREKAFEAVRQVVQATSIRAAVREEGGMKFVVDEESALIIVDAQRDFNHEIDGSVRGPK